MIFVKSALDNVMSDAFRQRVSAGDAVNEGFNFALAKAIESECSNIRSPDPRRLELWSVRDNQQHAKSSQPIHRGGLVAVLCRHGIAILSFSGSH